MDTISPSPKEGAQVCSTGEGLAILDRVRRAIADSEYRDIPIDLIRPMRGQPRTYFDVNRMDLLVGSIQQVGQLMPGFVRSIQVDASGHRFELVDGERRLIAVTRAGLPTYRALVVNIDDTAAQYLVSIIANFNREGHTVLEIVDSIRAAHEELKLTMVVIGELLGFHPIYVTNLYGLRRLVPAVRDMLDPEKTRKEARLPTSAAILISRERTELQLMIANAVVSKAVPLGFLPDHIAQLRATYRSPADGEDTAAETVAVCRPRHTDTRRNIKRKVTRLARDTEVIKALLEKVHETTLSDMVGDDLLVVQAQLQQAQVAIAAALAVVQKAAR